MASASLLNLDNLLTDEKDIPTKSIRGIGGHITTINEQGTHQRCLFRSGANQKSTSA